MDNLNVKTWQQRMNSMSPMFRRPGSQGELMTKCECMEKEIADLRTELARRGRAQGGNTSKENGSDRAPTTSTVSAPRDVREALRPFADLADLYDEARKNPPGFSGIVMRVRGDHKDYVVTVEHLRAARAALSSTEGAQAAPGSAVFNAEEHALHMRILNAERNQALEEAARLFDDNPHAEQFNTNIAESIRELKRTSTDQASADTGSAE